MNRESKIHFISPYNFKIETSRKNQGNIPFVTPSYIHFDHSNHKFSFLPNPIFLEIQPNRYPRTTFTLKIIHLSLSLSLLISLVLSSILFSLIIIIVMNEWKKWRKYSFHQRKRHVVPKQRGMTSSRGGRSIKSRHTRRCTHRVFLIGE